ncbi:hypothetical protein [Azospirillum sp.]|uniref:hypothetical protein n=1 Tax=Azospirillum sp. TaxID=34012 RepID=UPI003D721D7B
MKRTALLLPALLLLAAAPAPAQTQGRDQRAAACRNEAERFAATFTAHDRAGRGAGPADTPVPAPSTTGAERDMARRGGVLTPSPVGRGTQPEVDTAPGARAGTTLSDEDRRRMQTRVDEARAAADRGDADGCLRHLREARTAAREAGIGGGGAGSSAASGGNRGGSGGATGSGSLNTNTAGSRPPGAPPASGSTPGSVGGAAGGGAAGGGSGSR